MSSTQSSVFGTFRLINLHVRRRHLPFWPGLWLLRTACAITCNILRKKSVQLSGTQRLHCNVCLWQKSKPKDSRAPVETVISGVKREGGEERGGGGGGRILFEPSDICYIMTCTMETCWERKWRGIVKEWEELFSERERGSSVCVFSRLGLLNLCWKQYQLQQFPKKCVCGLHNIISLFEEAYYFSSSSQMNPVCELGISNMLLQLSVKLDRQIGVKEDQRLDFNSDL